MSEKVDHNCGIVVTHDFHDALAFGESLEHRGREAAGIAAIADDRIDVVKWIGKIGEFKKSTIFNILSHGNYHTFFFHNRYATYGSDEAILQHAHPHVIGAKKIDHKGNHIVLLDCETVMIHNGQVNPEYFGTNQLDFTSDSDTEKLLHFFKYHGEFELMRKIPGAYTLAIADKKRTEVIVMRDRTGIKPGVVGKKNQYYGVASEDIAFRKNGGHFIEELQPGTIYYFTKDGKSYRKEVVFKPKKRQCFFEWNYFANEDTILNGRSVRRIRELLGEMLAQEFPALGADIVTYLPESPEIAARRYAEKTNVPFREVFYKKKKERAFLGTTMTGRAQSIDQNLHIYTHMLDELNGKTLVIVDDSTVRGNNSKKAADLARKAGVKKIYHLNYTPPLGPIDERGIRRGCMFGVDMPPNDNFLIRQKIIDANGNTIGERNKSIKEISEELGLEIMYLSKEAMFEAFNQGGIPKEDLCAYCIGGQHPFEDLDDNSTQTKLTLPRA